MQDRRKFEDCKEGVCNWCNQTLTCAGCPVDIDMYLWVSLDNEQIKLEDS